MQLGQLEVEVRVRFLGQKMCLFISTQESSCTPMFIATLFTVAKGGTNSVSVHRRMNKHDVVYTYNRVLFNLEKEENSEM